MTDTNGDITITVDGKEIACRPGELLIQAAKRAGIYIPFFCWHPRMDPVGACRMCLVHIEGGPPKPQTSCTTRVADGMVVQTQFSNPEIRKAQEGMLEFLLINHPLDCPICDRGGECPLQDQTQDYGPAESRFLEPKRRFVKPVSISPLVKLDRERCILCYRCTRFCEELSGDTLIGVMERGPKAYIYPFEGEAFDSYFSGNTVQICPVGALTSAPYRFQARPWDLQYTNSICNLCSSGCSLQISVRVADGNVIRFSAATNEDTNEEWLCDKGRFGHAYVSSPERLTQPLIRTGDVLQPVSWDEAFRALGQRLGGVAEDGGGDAGLVLGGSLCDEDYYAAQKLARVVLRTNNVDCRLEGGMSTDALMPPALGYDDVLGADRVVLVSLDAREEVPLLFLRLRIAAAKRGVGIEVVHSRRPSLAEFADGHVHSYPGAEAAVGAAVAAALGQPVAAGVEALAAGAGVAAADVRALAERLRASERPVILLGPWVVADPQAVQAWRTVARACGGRISWTPRRAGEYGALAAGAHPGLLPGWRLVADAEARRHIESAWGTSLPENDGLDAASILRRAASGDLEVLWIIGADVLDDVPDARLGADALRGARFCIVQDIQQVPLLDHADVVLPAAAFAERAGTLTDWEGRRQPVNQAVDPPGAARADYAILAETARRLGVPIGCRTIDEVTSELAGLLPGHAGDGGGDVGTIHAKGHEEDGEFPLRLHTYRLLYDDGSRVRHTRGIRDLTPLVFAEIHPADAERLRVADGESVRLWSRHGSLTAPLRVSDRTREGVVFVPYAQPNGSARELLSIDDPSPGVRIERA